MAPTHQTTPISPSTPAVEITQRFASPSSSTEGFFQAPPNVQSQFDDDIALQRALSFFLPDRVREELIPELSTFSRLVLAPKITTWINDAEKNPPYVKHWDSWGKRRDVLITSEGWRNLQALGIQEGIVAIPYDNERGVFSRVHQFAKYHLWAGSAAWVNCPSLMVDGVAALLRRHLSDPAVEGVERDVLRSAYDRLTSRDPITAWTTGQWMTERAGGSDVSQTETLATYAPDASPRQDVEVTAVDGHPLGPWKIDGFKWFSSATDADMVVMLARTTKGISTFFAPMRKTVPASARDMLGHETELNGISIQRLKSKLGTRALPTAELVLNGTRGYIIGEDGKGTKEITTVLNIARIHNGFTAIGLWGRGLSVVRAFGRARSVGQKPLLEKTAYVTTVAKMHVEYRANVLFNYFVAGLLGVVEQEQIKAFRSVVGGAPVAVGSVGRVPGLRDAQMAEHLLRLLTPVLKGVTAKTAIAGLAECMECLGGVGYLENDDQIFNIARLYRDANVLSIWEGTTDMMAHDVLRVVYGKTKVAVLSAMRDWVKATCASTRLAEQKKMVSEWWNRWETWLRNVEKGEAEMKARVVMERLADVVQGVLLIADAESDGDRNAVDVLDAWLSTRRAGMGLSGDEGSAGSWRVTSARNMRVVYTAESPVGGQAKL
ncbi:hypothetical protein B0A55_02680 [Friedmanniomyces simplex]|uniref:Acyl-CoA dehydrogenase/oxidase C-terminal domain-containing protein n=1 Tax=Friedmanniomyces simplex TaxID=329884 RepID=A0A4U0XQE1_9PEZI|nr:hypothetical protein B0A55_02680 [Friedmanniomyces simplex]